MTAPLPAPDAPLRQLAPAAIAVITCNGSPTLYVEEPTYAAIRTLEDAWTAAKMVHQARRLSRMGVRLVGGTETGGAA